jgi:S1-C subfamily serine protease
MKVAAIALLAALVGALIALGVADSGGWFDNRTRVVVVPEQAPADPAALVRAGNRSRSTAFDPQAVFSARSSGVVTLYAEYEASGEEAQGTGFVVTRTGLILTSSHVITNAGEAPAGTRPTPASKVYVEFSDRDRVEARIVGWDVFDDVGVIKVDPGAHPLRPVPLGRSAGIRVGQSVAVIGSPFGNENSLLVGIVAGVHRSIDSLTSSFRLGDAIQLDAPITHGNSGGPVFDVRGHVIGIAAQIRTDTGQAEGVGFAVPIDSARRSLVELVSKGEVKYAYIGVRTVDLTPGLSRRLGLSARHGAIVVSVEPGSAAEKAGLRPGTRQVTIAGVRLRARGDVILGVGGTRVNTGDDLARLIGQRLRPGQRVVFSVLRAGHLVRVRLRLGTRHG